MKHRYLGFKSLTTEMPTNGSFYRVRFTISLVSSDFFLISFLIKLHLLVK